MRSDRALLDLTRTLACSASSRRYVLGVASLGVEAGIRGRYRVAWIDVRLL